MAVEFGGDGPSTVDGPTRVPATSTAPRRDTATLAARTARIAGLLLAIGWIALLYLPAAITFPPAQHWNRSEWSLALAPAWLLVALRLTLGRRTFFLATLPIAFVGALCLGGAALRGVNVLQLMLDWRTFRPAEIRSSIAPYLGLASLAGIVLVAWCASALRLAPHRAPDRRRRRAAIAGTLLAAALVPPATWPHTWPINAALVAAAAPAGSGWLSNQLFPKESHANPRDPNARWNATRIAGAPPAETVVFVIGETVRADYLHECGGPERVRRLAPGALVACDMTASSDLTSSSVPLLVSREMPGHDVRVSNDATFAHALREAGFETHWNDLQGIEVAWPDAEHQSFPLRDGADRTMLVPPMVAALRRPAPLKAIVLHGYNAHDPYCARFDPRTAPYAVDCLLPAEDLDPISLRRLHLSYANAVDATVGFLDEVIEQLRQRPEPVFFVYTSDHGEALLDDSRQIWSHALRHPTRWDAQVPAVFWANDAWRATHAAQWANLQAQIRAPLMHADVVPTLLAAADVRYDEPRRAPVNLLSGAVPPRPRDVQVKFGETISWQTLVDEARDAGPYVPRY
jgi:glucan phosphoethanolaminetransferase (alkaline phosphatase superfamily)